MKVILFLSVFLFTSAAIDDEQLVTMYETPFQESIPSDSSKTVFAYTDCPKNKGRKMIVCAELPHNWSWMPGGGYVALHTYNNASLSGTPICSTGWIGSGVVPTKCCEIQSWPGGDLFVDVRSNDINPVTYTISVVIEGSAANREKRTMKLASLNTKTVRTVSDPMNMIQMLPVIKSRTVMNITYIVDQDSYKELKIDLCLKDYSSTTFNSMNLAVTGLGSGSYHYYVCTKPNCLPNQHYTVASQPTDLVISSIEIPADKIKTSEELFIRVYASTGDDDGNGNYVAHFLLGASLH